MVYMDWISINEIKSYDPTDSILIWQHNLVDIESSRFQRAVYYESHIVVYPLTHSTTFKKNEKNEFVGYDLEGDLCQVTHFAIINPPNK
jgi:hypothetical protein